MTKYLLVLLVLLAIGCVACTQPSVQPLAQPTVQPLPLPPWCSQPIAQPSAQPLAQPPRPAHVVIVIEENKNYEDIIDSANAPYINCLAKMGASLNIYAFHHPSQPNYYELFAGTNRLDYDYGEKQYQYFVLDDRCMPGKPDCTDGLSETQSLGGLLGKDFLGYAEDWPSDEDHRCACLGDKTPYARKHVPWTAFEDSIDASRTFTDFKTLSSFDQLPLVSIVIPNLIHDMHSMPGSKEEGSDKDIPTLVVNGNNWLQENLDAYVQWAMKNNSLLIVTWDENSRNKEEGHDNGKGFEPPKNHMPTILVGQMVMPGSTSPGTYNHYDLLRTIQDMYGLRPYLGGSDKARDITDIWQ